MAKSNFESRIEKKRPYTLKLSDEQMDKLGIFKTRGWVTRELI